MNKYLVELDELEMSQIQHGLSELLLLSEGFDDEFENLEILINKLKSTKPIGKSNILAT